MDGNALIATGSQVNYTSATLAVVLDTAQKGTQSVFASATFIRDSNQPATYGYGYVTEGGCLTFQEQVNLLGTLTYLDAGTLSIMGPTGTQPLPKITQGQEITYSSNFPTSFFPSTGGSFTFQGAGGPDVGSFSVTVSDPSPLVWTNQAAITSVNRNQDLTVTWTGGIPGTWVQIGATFKTIIGVTPTLVTLPGDRAFILFKREPTPNKFTYEAALVASNGTLAVQPFSVFGAKYWLALTDQPTLVMYKSEPLVIFEGSRSNVSTDPYSKGCIVGDLGSTSGLSPWSLQSWSLSHSCVNDVGSAGAGPSNKLAGAWSSNGVAYRVGVSATIPATGPDSQIALSTAASANKTGVVSNLAGNGDFYVAWAQVFSKVASHDGFYVKDVTSGSTVKKAPGSGTLSSLSHLTGTQLALAATSAHPDIYLAYCSNTTTCRLELWRVGATHAITVPASYNAQNVALSAGPDGRLWIAWYNQDNTVSTVRTNKADTVFGPVRTYPTPCFGNIGLLALSSGNWGRVDVAMECLPLHANHPAEYVTQSVTGLAVSPDKVQVSNTTAHTVVFKVTDAGDPVKGAVVTVNGHHATTGLAGTASIVIPKGAGPGSFTVTAAGLNYISAKGTLSIVK